MEIAGGLVAKAYSILCREVGRATLRCMTHDIIHKGVPRATTWLGKTSEVESISIKEPDSLGPEHGIGWRPVTEGSEDGWRHVWMGHGIIGDN